MKSWAAATPRLGATARESGLNANYAMHYDIILDISVSTRFFCHATQKLPGLQRLEMISAMN